MRSLLLAPGDSRLRLDEAMRSGADALVIDLEASVPPSAKEEARRAALAFLQGVPARDGRPALYVRLNGFASGLTEADLAVMAGAPEGIVLPRAVGGRDVQRLAARLAVRETEFGLPAGSTRILTLAAGSAAGVVALGTLAGSSARLSGIAWDAGALAADLGAEASRDEGGGHTESGRLARSMTLLAAAAAGVEAVDAAFTDACDLDGLARECRQARRDGFAAKLALHPGQVAIINEAFTPSPGRLSPRRETLPDRRRPGREEPSPPHQWWWPRW